MIWSQGGYERASVGIRGKPDWQTVEITYTTDGEDKKHVIRTEQTPCNFGGFRNWFLCPTCHSRVGVLFLARGLACRKCYDVMYNSQGDDRDDKYLRIVQKIRRQLGGSMNLTEPFPVRPLGMHHMRYDYLETVHDRAMDWYTVTLMMKYGIYERLMEQSGKPANPPEEWPSEEDIWGADYAPQGYAPGEELPPDIKRLGIVQ